MAWPTKGRYSPRKGAKRLPERIRRRVLARYPSCQLCILPICTRHSTEVHHVWDQSDGGPDVEFLDDGTKQLVGVCHQCHEYVSARRSSAKGNAARNRRIANADPGPEIPFRPYSEMGRWQ